MRIRLPVAAAGIGLACLFVAGIPAEAAEIKVLSAVPMQQVMEDVAPKFERATGHTLALTFATLGEVVKRIQDGESADVVLIPRQGTDSLVKDGKVAADHVTVIARSGIAVAVRKGAPKPDISSPEALKRTLLAAKSITYSDPAAGGASGNHFTQVIERLGIVNEMKPKTILAKPGDETGVLVANGQAELGVHQFQVLMSVAGIEIVGPLPGDLQDTIVFAAAIMGDAGSPEASKELVDFLRTPEAAGVIKAKGMEPAGR
jgi:molybdate transport system substrate-binding protein